MLEPLVHRAPYLALRERPVMDTFAPTEAPMCSNMSDLQLAQYTGRLVYSSFTRCAVIDLETMCAQVTDVDVGLAVDTCCVLPEGMATLGFKDGEVSWVDETWKRAGQMRAVVGFDALLSESEPVDLSHALVKGQYWHVPSSDRGINNDAFRAQTGWRGQLFVRLVGGVFLFYDWANKRWKIIRVHVP